jgi:hypothetical protein
MASYHTHHAPFGAFASFTLGLDQAPGGFGQSLGGPARQNVYVGVRQAPSLPWRMLPFFTPPRSEVAAYTGEGAPPANPSANLPYEMLTPGRYGRSLAWASDRWLIGPLVFKLHTPFARTTDPEQMDESVARFHFAPVVCGYLEYDNTHSAEPVELLFGLGDPSQPLRPLHDDGTPALVGFAAGTRYGFATTPSPEVCTRQGFSVFTSERHDGTGHHRLGSQAALLFTVPAGQKRVYPLVLGFYDGGVVTTGIATEFYYAKLFRGLEDVLCHGLAHHARYVALADERDAEWFNSPLSPAQKFLLAQATHSYFGSTQLLRHGRRPLFVVNEGEYRMMNTFDLTVDHLFFELAWHPWAVRNVLDQFATRYHYRDTLHTPDGQRADGGLSFTHDMGVANQFSPAGRSSYECIDLHGCFSHMTAEQLINWICCAVTYAEKTGHWEWLKKRRRILRECARSLERRDHPEPKKRDGLVKWDSDRCGAGSEITTYDSLDVSLGQARNNLYLAVKALAAWLLLEHAWAKLGASGPANRAGRAADRLVRTLVARFEEDTGFFPAVFESGNRSRILPAIEGLVFPLYLNLDHLLARDGRLGPLLQRLERHLAQALQPGLCLDAHSGGWKISSTSHNTWFSKIALAQYVARRLFPAALNDAARRADDVHAAWQKAPGCGPWAMCDQIHSETGQALGSKYYPRGVTAWLWTLE